MNTPPTLLRRLSRIVHLAVLAAACSAPPVPGGEIIEIFDGRSLAGWENKAFQGQTRYRLVQDGDRPALRADSHAAASGLVRKIEIDLERTPYLNWSWRVEGTLGKLHEREKSGDDFAARVYVIVSGGLLFWRTKAINYVWANTSPAGDAWPNPYTHRAHMVALESGAAHAGQWRSERRNVRDDFRRWFGENVSHIHAVALMTDTDDSAGQARAYYGPVYFSSE
ncbi:MAG TPA: DUF3047 domain-containing protein [Gammaproteobacteria bacterium]|nr:DUF3047 domain-containing protein [Gammaproteobacteria bacterium]